MTKICVIGTTTWGTTLAVINSNRDLEVTLLSRSPEETDLLKKNRKNLRFLPDTPFPDNLQVTDCADSAIGSSKIIIFAVPSHTLRSNVAKVSTHFNGNHIIVSATKGLEAHTSKRMSEIIKEEIQSVPKDQICVMSGPNLASEIIKGKPSSTVVASENLNCSTFVQSKLNSSKFRIYTNTDIIGVEIGGALKNVTAIAAGISDGLFLGDNAKASIITRGLAEMSRLGTCLGADKLTFSGLAGMGDLIATCSSDLSRNRRVGISLAKGLSLSQISKEMDNVAEGISTTKAVIPIAQKHKIAFPIGEAVYSILFNGSNPSKVAELLMERRPKQEN
jgi:glycerol-3-phosphate dehydrogenase (NAD(P)+)